MTVLSIMNKNYFNKIIKASPCSPITKSAAAVVLCFVPSETAFKVREKGFLQSDAHVPKLCWESQASMILLSGLKRTARKVRGHARNEWKASFFCIRPDTLVHLMVHIFRLQR